MNSDLNVEPTGALGATHSVNVDVIAVLNAEVSRIVGTHVNVTVSDNATLRQFYDAFGADNGNRGGAVKFTGFTYRPRQYEFNKLNLNYTLMSKRNLLILVKEGLVNGWDDPRMPTLCGFRRRGYSPESIRGFVDKIGYTTYDALNDFALLESAVRDDLNKRATRVSAVLDPVKLVITNYPEGQVEAMEAVNNPEDPESGTHTIEFSRELWMEREDFMEDAPKKYFRMTPGQEVRLKNAYIVKCTGCDKDENGNVTTVYAEYDPDTKTGMPGSNRKVKGTLHWVSCDHCIKAEVRLYDRLWLTI